MVLELNRETTPLPVTNTESRHDSTRTLQLSYRVICTSDYYGPNCSVYCVPRDDSSGHYTCNQTDGSRICTSHFYGPDCSVYCVPRNDSSGYYTCNQMDGSRICMSDYYGPDCSVYCVSRDDFTGHYTCNTTDGSKVCMSGFGVENCTLAETTGVGQGSQGNSDCQSLWTVLLIFIRCFSLLQITIAFHSSL